MRFADDWVCAAVRSDCFSHCILSPCPDIQTKRFAPMLRYHAIFFAKLGCFINKFKKFSCTNARDISKKNFGKTLYK